MTLSSRSRMSVVLLLVTIVGTFLVNAAFQHPAAHADTPDVLVSNGSPPTPFPRNKQNEPAFGHPLVCESHRRTGNASCSTYFIIPQISQTIP